MTTTENYKLKKPGDSDNVLIEELNSNFDTIDAELKKKLDPASPKEAGNLAGLNEAGQIFDSGKNPDDFAGSQHTHSAEDIDKGVLPVARGGTGAATAAGARENLGVYPASELYKKSEIITDITKALFGLATDALPNEAFAFLGKYNQHWWKRRTTESGWQPALSAVYSKYNKHSLTTSNGNNTVFYSDTVTVTGANAVSLNNPTQLSINYASDGADNASASVLKGKYFYASSNAYDYYYPAISKNVIYYIPPDAELWDYATPEGDSGSEYLILTDKLSTGTGKYVTGVGEWEYLQAASPDAYPTSGIVSSYEYVYLGVPFENALEPARIEVASYVGAGVYGSDNPNSVTFSFAPKIVIMANDAGYYGVSGTRCYKQVIMYAHKLSTEYVSKAGFDGSDRSSLTNYGKMSEDGKTFSWYSTYSASGQYNVSGTNYTVIAIG